MPLPRHSSGFYRTVLALPLGMAAYLFASGRFAEYWRQIPPDATRAVSADAMSAQLVTSLLWLVAVAPLLYAAWEIGRHHTAARRLDYAVLVGLREVVRRAVRVPDAAGDQEIEAAFARRPRDRPGVALGWGMAVAVFVPVFFASFSPGLRTLSALAWLGGAGLLIGFGTYCRHRAMAYLRDEPGRWDMARHWRLLNPARYEPGGRVFVRCQIAVSVLFPVWWLGGGMFIVFKP